MTLRTATLVAGLASGLIVKAASATTLTIAGGGATGADGFASFTLTITNGKLSGFDYDEDEQTFNFVDEISTSFSDPNATFTTSNPTTQPGIFGPIDTLDYTVFDPSFPFSVANTNGATQTLVGYSFTFTLFASNFPDGSVQYTSASAGTILGSQYGWPDGYAFVTSVPLPASAPLFGAALLALGAVGHGMKRKVAGTTA